MERLQKQASVVDVGSGRPPPPHVMVSYNWDHQEVILRVVASLQDRGYLVWVDTEQMKGATVDTMALAVEGSEVVLIGVSRAYKESSNCRMEAQYALQKKKAFAAAVLFGFGNVTGAVFGGLLLGITEQLSAAWFPDISRDLVSYLILLFWLWLRGASRIGSAAIVFSGKS